MVLFYKKIEKFFFEMYIGIKIEEFIINDFICLVEFEIYS